MSRKQSAVFFGGILMIMLGYHYGFGPNGSERVLFTAAAGIPLLLGTMVAWFVVRALRNGRIRSTGELTIASISRVRSLGRYNFGAYYELELLLANGARAKLMARRRVGGFIAGDTLPVWISPRFPGRATLPADLRF